MGGKYGFGNFTVAASYQNVHKTNSDLIRRGFGLGASAKFGACTLTLDLTRDTKNQWGAKKYTNAVLEGKYDLSKRTFLYANFLRLDKTNNWGMGIHHSF